MKAPVPDNVGFRMHYGFTTGFFFLATALLSISDLVGKALHSIINFTQPPTYFSSFLLRKYYS